MQVEPFEIARHSTLLRVTPFDDGGAFYELRAYYWGKPARTLLAFSVTAQGWLVGDGRDMQTARRAQRLTGNWALYD